jgi:L-ribulose-5-phosphate 4-epimerase
MKEFESLRQQVLEANLAIARAGLVILSFGNASGADHQNGVMAIKSSGISCSDLTLDDVVVVDIDNGRTVVGNSQPSTDTPTHVVLYQAIAGIGGIVHTHSTFATSWAQACRELPCFGTTHSDHFNGSVPVTRALRQDELDGAYEEYTGRAIVETFTAQGIDPLERPGVLVASHGPFVWAGGVEGAVINAIALESIAASALWTELLRPDISPVGDLLRQRHFLRKHGPQAYYGQPTAGHADE